MQVMSPMKLIADRNGLIHTENAFKIGPYIASIESQGKRVVRCNLGEPDFPLASHIKEEIKRQIDADNVHYTDPQGILPLRTAIAEHISSSRGIEVSAERVVVYPGGKPPIGFCQQTYCNPGDEVIYPSPGYPIYESFIRYVGATPRPLRLREELGFSFSGDDLAELINERTKLIFVNFPSNPTGGVASREQLEEIVEVIESNCNPSVRVYSDEIYEDILYDGARHISIASIGNMAAKTIIASGASKSYSWTGGRIGWAVFPTVEEAKISTNLNINYFSCIPPYNQHGAVVALQAPESRTFIAEMNAAFASRRDYVVQALNATDGISCQLPKGAFYVFPNIAGVVAKLGADSAWSELPDDVRRKTSPSTLFQMFLLFEYQVATMDRRSFGQIGSENEHYLRFSIATAMDDLKIAMESLAKAVEDENGFNNFVRKAEHLY